MVSPLEFTGIGKHYGAQQVLDGISFALREGEMFGLIGLNGAGKTTLIKILLHLASQDAGNCTLFGTPPANPSARSQLVYLPEKFQPSRYLTGDEYLSLSLSHFGKAYDADAARELAARFHLEPKKLSARVGSYSKGMGQKLGLMGALLADVPLLVLDEPMSGLDPLARIALKQALSAQRDKGRTVFFSSHILSDIDEICDRIGVIHAGRLSFCGTPADFKTRHPAPNLEQSFLSCIAA